MATKQYLDEDGLAIVADKVNEKLKVVSTMPSTPTNGQVVLYVGATTSTLTQGGIYMYNSTSAEWVLISTADVDLTPYKKIFTGTQAEWNQLTLAEKKEYDEADLTDDLAGGELIVTDAVTDGDLNPVTSNAVAQVTTAKLTPAITENTGASFTKEALVVKVIGKMCHVFGIYGINAQMESVTVATGLPKPYAIDESVHSLNFYLSGARGSNSESQYAYITKNGALVVYTDTAGGNFYFSGCYRISD